MVRRDVEKETKESERRGEREKERGKGVGGGARVRVINAPLGGTGGAFFERDLHLRQPRPSSYEIMRTSSCVQRYACNVMRASLCAHLYACILTRASLCVHPLPAHALAAGMCSEDGTDLETCTRVLCTQTPTACLISFAVSERSS